MLLTKEQHAQQIDARYQELYWVGVNVHAWNLECYEKKNSCCFGL